MHFPAAETTHATPRIQCPHYPSKCKHFPETNAPHATSRIHCPCYPSKLLHFLERWWAALQNATGHDKRRTAPHCNTWQYTATYSNTHCNSLSRACVTTGTLQNRKQSCSNPCSSIKKPRFVLTTSSSECPANKFSSLMWTYSLLQVRMKLLRCGKGFT